MPLLVVLSHHACNCGKRLMPSRQVSHFDPFNFDKGAEEWVLLVFLRPNAMSIIPKGSPHFLFQMAITSSFSDIIVLVRLFNLRFCRCDGFGLYL